MFVLYTSKRRKVTRSHCPEVAIDFGGTPFRQRCSGDTEGQRQLPSVRSAENAASCIAFSSIVSRKGNCGDTEHSDENASFPQQDYFLKRFLSG